MSDAPDRQFGFETRMLHAGHVPDALTGARAVPIYQTTSYVFDDADTAAQLFELKQYGNIYTRIGNPTTAVLEERLASLENATGAVAVASGMAAQFVALMTLLSPGDEIVASSHLYGGTVTQLTHTLPQALGSASGSSTRRGSSIGSRPSRRAPARSTARPSATRGAASSTSSRSRHSRSGTGSRSSSTTPSRRPISAGRWTGGPTIVVHSATKFIGGHGTSIGGAVLESGRFDYSHVPAIADPSPSYHGLRFFDTFGHYGFLMKVRAETVRDTGACLSPTNAFLLLQGLETLSLRMERHASNALAVARFLRDHPRVAWVAYAGLEDHPEHALACKYLGGRPGAVFSFGLKTADGDGRAAGRRFIDALRLFSHLANVGDARSLVIHPASTTHQQLSEEELTRGGVAPELIRLSVGLETLEDLLWDLDQALHATFA